MRQRGQSPQARRASQGDASALIAEARARALAVQPAMPWQYSAYAKSSSGAGNFAVHGQSVRQVQVRTLSFSSRDRALNHSQSANATTSKQLPDKLQGNAPDNVRASQRYLGMLKAMPRSNSMPSHTSLQGAQAPMPMARAPRRPSSRGRQDRPADTRAPTPAGKSELNGFVFKQCRRSDNLVVARTLAARLASPHSLHLDNLKLTDCCIIEGEEQVTTLSYQHNNISCIGCLEQLPQLTILDMYSNQIQSLQGLPKVPALRGLMLGRNFLSVLSGLEVMTSLEVLDLQSNLIEAPQGLASLTGLRRLNLAGNRITSLCSLRMLTCLEDLSLSRNYIALLHQPDAAQTDADSDVNVPLLPTSLRKLALGHNRLASFNDLQPLQQLTALRHLELEGNPCCSLHPPSRFRIEVVARHCSHLQHLDSQQITHAERSLAAAMRWQDEMASRASLPVQSRIHSTHGQPAPRPHSAKSDSQTSAHLLGRAPRIPVPARSATPTLEADHQIIDQQRKPVPSVEVKQTSSASISADAPDRHSQPALSSEQDASADRPGLAAALSQAELAAASGSDPSFSHAEHAALARLPSAKGHHLVSYASSMPTRPASPVKNPTTPGDLLSGSALSVKTLSMQVSKAVPPETSAKTGSCAVDSDPAVLSLTRTNSNAAGQQISGLQQNPDPSLTPLCSNTTAAVCSSSASDGLHGVVEHTQSEQAQAKGAVCESVGKAGISGNSAAAATDVGPIISSYSGRAACASGTSPLPGMPQQPQDTLQRVNSVGQAGPRMQHAIPERLLTASQASALLSGLPPGSQSAWLKQQGGFVGYTDPPDSLVTGSQEYTQSLLCVGQTQPQSPRASHQHPQDPHARQAAAASSQQQQHQQKPTKSAELIDGYQLHIRGDAMDALRSPVCANAQEVTLTGLMWDRVTAGMQSLAALPHVRKLTLIDNELQHLHQADELSVLTGLQELTLKHNPVAKQVLLRSYVCFQLPNLRVFNGCAVTAEESAQAQSMFQALQAARTTANKDPFVMLARRCRHDSAVVHNKQAGADQMLSTQSKEHMSVKLNADTTLAVQSLWSGMLHKLVQQDMRAKRFEEIWPGILDEMILKGFTGVY